jgi:hypothetical protein
MYIYVDKYDYLISNINNELIDEEIEILNKKIKEIEENNIYYLKSLKESIIKDKNSKKFDVNSDKVKLERFENITNQIFTLQMKQFAESISNIKKDIKKNKYILIFDTSEAIDPLTLDEPYYKELLKYRDPMNSISIYDLFQEKIHSYYNLSPQKEENKKKKGRPRLNKNISDEEIQIAKVVSINYDFCHHCKQRKPAEVMVRCNSKNSPKFVEKPMKVFNVNNTTVVRSK